jgi:hypothetical protein
MLDDADMRFAIDDARVRQKAVIDLINGSSDQALRLLGFYITLGLAATSGAIAGISATTSIPIAVAIALLSVLVPLVIGSYFCFQTIRPTSIALPGRDPEFWLWAHRSDVTRDVVFKAYLDNLNERMAANRRLNDNTSKALTRAKICGAVAPLVALLSGSATALALRLLLPRL